mmetsp:Transcript_15026/g.42603  ORF Transcript_15026/g.42603 Transcript_15026/m.42603 type:complete len:220 (-) Transcript_15026:988-1647(-)
MLGAVRQGRRLRGAGLAPPARLPARVRAGAAHRRVPQPLPGRVRRRGGPPPPLRQVPVPRRAPLREHDGAPGLAAPRRQPAAGVVPFWHRPDDRDCGRARRVRPALPGRVWAVRAARVPVLCRIASVGSTTSQSAAAPSIFPDGSCLSSFPLEVGVELFAVRNKYKREELDEPTRCPDRLCSLLEIARYELAIGCLERANLDPHPLPQHPPAVRRCSGF